MLTVEAGSPAERAGLRPGDLLLGMDGQELASVDALYQALRPECVGRDCVLKLLRPGSTQALYLTVRPLEAAEG